MKKEERLADFLFEVGTMRKLARMHRQVLMTDDLSDNIATHSFRVAVIGALLAEMEGVNVEKVVLMCLVHDFSEARSNDHNWVHKRYVAIDEKMIRDEQLGTLPTKLFSSYAEEYAQRMTPEAKVAKEADLLDQILLLREYSWQGNKEATAWLYGKGKKRGNEQLKKLTLASSRKLGKAMYERTPSQWWEDLWTSKNREVKSKQKDFTHGEM